MWRLCGWGYIVEGHVEGHVEVVWLGLYDGGGNMCGYMCGDIWL